MKVRVKFTKTGPLRFIGHLDVLRFFQRAIRRSGISAAYSGGFSPHMQMSFAEPLGIGQMSEGDYFDLTLLYRDPLGEEEESVTAEEAARRAPCPPTDVLRDMLNAVMPPEIRILSIRRIPPGKKNNAMALVHAADYRVEMPAAYALPGLAEKLAAFLAREEIITDKKTKSGIKPVNIRPMVLSAQTEPSEDKCIFRVSCRAGSDANLKPDLLLSAFYASEGIDVPVHEIRVCRTEMYALSNGSLIPLEKLGSEVL